MRVHHRFWLPTALLCVAVAVATAVLAGGLAAWTNTLIRSQGLAREVGIVLAPLLVIYALSFVLLLACLDFGRSVPPRGDLERLIGLKAGGGFPHRSRRGRRVRAAVVP